MADPQPQIAEKLPENAYRELKPGEEYVPMVPPGVKAPEITMRSIIFGLVMNILFAMAATYLALKVGQGIETAIPISILAVGLSGFLLQMGYRRSSIIENINVLAISTTSGIVAGGTCFTMPAIYLLGLPEKLDISTTSLFLQIFLVPFLGAVLGVVFLVPFRRYFVKEMHGKLPFPEGTATNEILVTGQTGGKNAFILVYSFIVAAFYTVLTGALRLFPEDFTTGKLHVEWKGTAESAGGSASPLAFAGDLFSTMTEKIKAIFSMGTGAEFIGLGFIIGTRYASIIMAGSVLSFFVIVPLLSPFNIEQLQQINAATEAKAGQPEAEVFFAIPNVSADAIPAKPAENAEDQSELLPDAIKAAFVAKGEFLEEIENEDLKFSTKTAGEEWRLVSPKQGYVLRAADGGGLAVYNLVPTGGEVFNNIPKNIGIGCIFTAGLLSILKMGRVIVTALREALGSLFRKKSGDGAATHDRTDQDISYPILGLLGVAVTVAITIYFRTVVLANMPNPNFLTFVSVLLALGVSFIFITVSAWAIATISVTPISGMTVTTIIVTAVAMMAAGLTPGEEGMLAVLLVGGVVASALSMAGTLVTEFKLGYWTGATPRKIQWSAIIASLLASAVVTATIMLLAESPGYDPSVNAQALQAPQANLMKSALQSFIGTGEVPWICYGTGVMVALLLELIGISPLAFGLGMYLPMSLNAPILAGALVAAAVQKGKADDATRKARKDKGIIIASGFIAGAAIIGVVLRGIGIVAPGFMESIDIQSAVINAASDPAEAAISIGRLFNWFGLIAFLLLCAFIFWDARRAEPDPDAPSIEM